MNTKVAASIFVLAIVTANLLVAEFGPWVSPINAFLLIGLDLSLRDYLHDKWVGSIWKMGVLIGLAGIVSYGLNPAAGRIAVASSVAFVASSLVDAGTYHALFSKRFIYKANGSNIAGAAVDSVAFPAIAFGFFPGVAAVIALQFAAKVSGGAIWAFVIDRVRSTKRFATA